MVNRLDLPPFFMRGVSNHNFNTNEEKNYEHHRVQNRHILSFID